VNPIVVPDYQLVEKCGRGAYGDVYVARSLSGSLVALKVIEKTKHSAKEFEGLKYYCSRCGNSPYLIKIFHTGETEEFFYYTMELADNCGSGNKYVASTMAGRLETDRRIPAAEVRLIALNLLEGLATLHEAGLVHRDIKPENVIFVNGVPKLSDIGLVSSVSATFSLGGTMGFIPPERLSASGGGAKSSSDDLYAMGKLIYCVFTGYGPDKFPSIPGDMVLDEDTRRLNEVVLLACSKVGSLRFHSIEKFRQALMTSVSKKRAALNSIWLYRYYWVAGIGVYIVFAVALWMLIEHSNQQGDDERADARVLPLAATGNGSGNAISPSDTMVRIGDGNNTIPYRAIETTSANNVGKNIVPVLPLSSNGTPSSDYSTGDLSGSGQKKLIGAVIPPVISDAEFKAIMATQSDGKFVVNSAPKVNYYLLQKGCQRFPELRAEFSAYLTCITAIEEIMFKQMPDKVAEIKTLARNCFDVMKLPSVLASQLTPEMWKDKKMRSLFCACLIRSENMKIIAIEKRSSLPEAIEWDWYLLSKQLEKRRESKPQTFKNPDGGTATDFDSVLAAYKEMLQKSPPDKLESAQKSAARFLESLRYGITTPEITALIDERIPYDMRLKKEKELSTFIVNNVNDYVQYKYAVNTWSNRALYVPDFDVLHKKITDGINKLQGVKQHREWRRNKEKRIEMLRENEMKHLSNPYVATYLKARSVLQPYLNSNKKSAESENENQD